jgi:hypothetical protein
MVLGGSLVYDRAPRKQRICTKDSTEADGSSGFIRQPRSDCSVRFGGIFRADPLFAAVTSAAGVALHAELFEMNLDLYIDIDGIESTR